LEAEAVVAVEVKLSGQRLSLASASGCEVGDDSVEDRSFEVKEEA